MANFALNLDFIGNAGRQLYGEHWQAPLSEALGIDPRLLRYWLNGRQRPTIEQLRTLVSLLQHSIEANQRLVSYFERVLGRAEGRDLGYSFEPSELRRLDRRTVEHLPTGSRAVFYEYPTQPPDDYIPGASITNASAWREDDLVRFNVAAWKLLFDYRYKPYMTHVHHYARIMPDASADEIVKAVQREFVHIPADRIRLCLRELVEQGKVTSFGKDGLVTLADPKPIVRRDEEC